MASIAPIPVRFEGEEDGEQVLFLLRAHQFTNLGWVLITLAFLAVPLCLKAFPIGKFLDLDFDLESGVLLLVAATWFLIVLGLAFQQFLHWYFNIYILTNKRIVDIDFYGLFYRSVSQTTLSNVQDITYTKGGIAQNFFDYGDIRIQTAGTAANFEFENIPDPEGSQKQILELVAKANNGSL
jgi:uncharacterized membrane protein YdbT with pleckstrin-like domain